MLTNRVPVGWARRLLNMWGTVKIMGLFLGPYYNTGPNTGPNLGDPKGTIILTVRHVSWECLEYAEERGAVVSQLRVDLEQLPVCFRYAAVVPQDFVLSDHEIRLVQIFLVETWRRHIIRWYSGSDIEQMARVQCRQLTDEGLVENGHLLAQRQQGGFWCRLCGNHTALAKHVRLKITRQPCANQGGEILEREGFYHNDNRLDQLERELNIRYNLGKHLLHWNRRTGKELGSQEEGWLQCLRCRRKWRWKELSRICRGLAARVVLALRQLGGGFVKRHLCRGCHGPNLFRQDVILQFFLLKSPRVS